MESVLERRPYLVPVVLGLLTVLLLKAAVLPSSGQVLDGKDLGAFVYPLYTMTGNLVRAGELPLWNPYSFLGAPLIGNPQATLFYPATWLVWLVGAERGIGWMLALHVWLAAWGMARLARTFGASYTGGLAAGILYGMSEFVGARFYAGHYTLLLVYGWMPWAIAAYRQALLARHWRAALPGAVVMGLVLLAGHPPLTFYLGLCLVGLLVYHVVMAEDARQAAWDGVLRLAVMGVGGLVLGAALVLPAVELTAVSVRENTTPEFINSFALPPAQYLNLVVPGLFGNPKAAPSGYWGADFYEEFGAYAGLLPLLAVPLALRRFRREQAYFIGLMGVGIVLSVGLQGVLLNLMANWLPGASLFRSSGRGLYFVVLGGAGLAGLVITQMQQMTIEERRALLQPALRRWLPVGIGLAVVGAVFYSGWYASASHVEPMPTRAFMVAGALALSAVAGGGLWLALWLYSQATARALKWALPLLLVVVMWDAWRIPLQVIQPTADWRDPLWIGAAINIPLDDGGRVVQIPADSPYNGSLATGHLHVLGYDPLTIGTYDRLMQLSDAHDPQAAANTLMGVRYVLTKAPYERENYQLIGIADGGIYYERLDAFPRVWVAEQVVVEPNDDAVRAMIAQDVEALRATAVVDRAVDCPYAGGGTATIRDYHPNSVSIETQGDGGMLVLSDQYYAGWEAQVDGVPVETARAFTAFRAVCVPAGEHKVTFSYRPVSLLVGGGLSLVGWLGIGIWFVRRRGR